MIATTDGYLLDGRVRYAQPVQLYRTGIEPVLLAASIPARPGQSVIEAGTGAGAALLCLAARVPDLTGCGVELDPDMAEIARHNLAANGVEQFRVLACDVQTLTASGTFDHAFANPPWHDPAGTASPQSALQAAKRASPGLLAAWAAALGEMLRDRGTLTLILPAAQTAAGLRALEAASCGSLALLPLWPKVGRAAKLVLIKGVRGGAGPCRLLSGLVLHDAAGAYTESASQVLREAAALEF